MSPALAQLIIHLLLCAIVIYLIFWINDLKMEIESLKRNNDERRERLAALWKRVRTEELEWAKFLGDGEEN